MTIVGASRAFVCAVLLMGPVACGGTRPAATTIPEGARAITLSVHGLDCAECSDRVEGPLRAQAGVYDVKFDRKRVVFTVMVAPSLEPKGLIDAIEKAGFTVELGDRGGSYLSPEEFAQGDDMLVVVSDGRDVGELASVAVKGKLTVVDLYAPWCGPCREVDLHMKKVLGKRPDVAYRKLDIVDWDSPLAKHQLASVPNLPYVVVFDAQGAKLDAISGLDLARLDSALGKGAPPP